MLQTIRDHTAGWIAGVIILLLVVPFAFWGIGDYFGLVVKNNAAEVNGQEISLPDFQQAYQGRYNQLRQLLGDKFSPELIDEPRLRQEVLDRLIDRALVMQHLTELGYQVSDSAVLAKIHEMPAFQQDGKFSAENYKMQLAMSGYTPALFEAGLREDLKLAQLQQAVLATAFATTPELERVVSLWDEERQLAYVTVPVTKFLDDVTVDEAAITAYYDAHQNAYMTEESVTVRYLELDVSTLADDVAVDEQALKAFYEERKAAAQQQEERHAAHILLTGPGAEAQAADLLVQIKNGADFAELAKQYSQDPGSKDKGGDLGWITTGMLVGPFEDKLFAMQDGEVAGPVTTDFGVHIIKLLGIRTPEFPDFETMHDQLVVDFRRQQVDERYYKLAEQLTELTYANPQTLDVAAEALGLPVQEITNVTRDGGNKIAANPAVRDAAFSSDVLQDGMNSDPVELGEHHVVVLRVADHQSAQPRPLAQVRDSIVTHLQRVAAGEQAAAAARALVDAVHGGETLEAAARAQNYAFVASAYINRNGGDVPPALAQAAFAAPAPAADQAQVDIATLDTGDVAVFQVTDVRTGRLDALTAEERTARERGLERRHGGSALQAYVQELRRNADITINQQVISGQ